MGRKFDVSGAAHMVVLDGVALLQPDAQVFECMLDGWRQQQLSRNLGFATVETRAQTVRRFQAHTNAYPWQWLAELLGYNPKVAAERAAELATDWAGYAALKSRDA